MPDRSEVETYLAEALLKRLNEKCDEAGIVHFDWCPICGASVGIAGFAEHDCPPPDPNHRVDGAALFTLPEETQ